MNRAPAGAILALPTWNHFGNACLQDAWILLYWEQSPESSGWAQIGKMSTQQCIWKQVPTSASFGGGRKCLWAFLKPALQMLPAWFFRLSLIWHTWLFCMFPWSERNGQPISCVCSNIFTHTKCTFRFDAPSYHVDSPEPAVHLHGASLQLLGLGELSHNHRIAGYMEPFLSLIWG